MDPGRRTWLACLGTCLGTCLGMGLVLIAAIKGAAIAQEAAPRVIEVRIENRQVVEPEEAIRITQGDTVELRWTSDETAELHLHGYDVELRVQPGEPAAMTIEAFAAGRFPITSHGWGGSGHGHQALTYLEVYPD